MLIHTDVFFPLLRSTQTSLSTPTFSFYFHIPHRLTRPHRHFLALCGAHAGQLVHKDVFCLCCSLHKPTRLHRRYLFTVIVHAGLTIHTGNLQQYTISRPYLIMGACKSTRQKSTLTSGVYLNVAKNNMLLIFPLVLPQLHL